MRLRQLVFTFLALGGTLYADDWRTDPQFRSLFNGRDLTGWCFRAKVVMEYRRIQIKLSGASPAPVPDQARGKRLFEGQCARCHGMQGGGGTGANLRRPKLRHVDDDDSLFDLIRDGIPGTAMPYTWAMTDNEVRDVIAYVRSLGRIPPEVLPGDPDKGRLIYRKAECVNCHIVAGKGGNLGPELSDIGSRRGVEFLRSALLHPGKDRILTEEGYATYVPVLAATKDGRVLTGMRVNEDTFTIQLRDTNNRLHSLQKSDLEVLQKLDGSLMPTYEKTLSRSDFDHIVSYLASLKGTP
jgi:putative heme-binding domain-containing protein